MKLFLEKLKNCRKAPKGLSYDLIAVLVGDTITEEALPTYESWLTMVKGVSDDEEEWMDAMDQTLDRRGKSVMAIY